MRIPCVVWIVVCTVWGLLWHWSVTTSRYIMFIRFVLNLRIWTFKCDIYKLYWKNKICCYSRSEIPSAIVCCYLPTVGRKTLTTNTSTSHKARLSMTKGIWIMTYLPGNEVGWHESDTVEPGCAVPSKLAQSG